MRYEELVEAFRDVPRIGEADPNVVYGFGLTHDWNAIERIARKHRDELTERDLERYTEWYGGPPHDYAYFLPAMLRLWRRRLVLYEDAYAQTFCSDLLRTRFFQDHLTAELRAAVCRYMREAILEVVARLDSLRIEGMSPAHRWSSLLNTHATLFEELPELWNVLWSAKCEGHAIGVLQYSASLVFDDEENPFFAPWDRWAGGGPLSLWGYDSMTFEECWLPSNVAFLRRTLTPSYLGGSVTRISGESSDPGIRRAAQKVLAELERTPDRAEARCTALVLALSRPEPEDELDEWDSLGAF